jgi:AcrR family transcriptional regulator
MLRRRKVPRQGSATLHGGEAVPETTAPQAGPRPQKRLPYAERRRQILDQAAEFFAEHGLAGQTRSLAHACAISQRLLYRFFPSKAALIDEVYEDAILGPFRTVWLVRLADRREPVEQRLNAFYRDYFETVLTRRWLRLFLYSSLANRSMAPSYNVAVVMPLLERIVEEVAHEQDLTLPDDGPLRHESRDAGISPSTSARRCRTPCAPSSLAACASRNPRSP